jgi:hypothetical protein
MGLADWALVTDGSSFLAIETATTLNGLYTCKIINNASSNYATYVYSTNAQIQSLETVKVEAIMMGDSDYYTDDGYYAPVTWNASTFGSTYSASGDTIWKSAVGGSWSNSAVSTSSIASWGIGRGIRVKFIDLPSGAQFFVGLDPSATSIAYNSLDLGAYIEQTNILCGYAGVSNTIYTVQGWRPIPNGISIKTTDILTMELDESGYMQFKLNGVSFFNNNVVAGTFAYPLYMHFCGYSRYAKISVQVNASTDIEYTPNSCPMIFTRLQGNSQSSDCYALMNSNNYTSLYKGNLNSPNITSSLLATYPTATPSMKTPYQYTLETYNIDASNVKIIAKKQNIAFYENEITKTTAGTNTAKRRGQNFNTILVDGGRLGTKCCNFIGNGYVHALHSDLNTMAHKSVEFWFKARDITRGCLLSRHGMTFTSNNQENRDFMFWLRNGNLYFTAEYYNGGYSTSPAYPILSNTWYHVAYTHFNTSSSATGNNYIFYINGVVQHSVLNVGYIEDATNTILLGANYARAWTNGGYKDQICNFFNGMIDSFHYIGSTVLTAQNVLDRYNSQNAGNEVELHANSKVLYIFEDSPSETELITYVDTISPILNGGKSGFGSYNSSGIYGASYFDDIKIYTEI